MTSSAKALKPHLAQRRRVLKTMLGSVFAGSAAAFLTPVSISSALAFEANTRAVDTDGLALSSKQLLNLSAICEAILPRTDSPGAAELDCHGFIDNQLHHCYSVKHTRSVRKIINKINRKAKAQFKTEFVLASLAQQQSLLRQIEAQQGFRSKHLARFKFVKSLTIFGFFTTEVGATKVLPYQALPGGYKGSVAMNEQTRVWGSMDTYW